MIGHPNHSAISFATHLAEPFIRKPLRICGGTSEAHMSRHFYGVLTYGTWALYYLVSVR